MGLTTKRALPLALLLSSSAAIADAPHDITGSQRLWLDGLDVNRTDTGNGGGTNPAAGATVSSWLDKSPNAFTAGDATSFSAGYHTLPTYASGGGVSFDGVWNILEIPAGLYGDGTIVTNTDILLVTTTRTIKSSFATLQGPISNTNARISTHIPWVDGTIYWDHFVGVGRLTASWNGNSSVLNRNYIWNFGATTSSNQSIARDGVTLASMATSGSYTEAAADHFYVGGGENASGNNHDGVISELLVYSRRLASAEKRILLSYLTAKYATPGGVGTESRYSNSAGYRYQVGGIGQEADGTLGTGTSAGLTLTAGTWLASGRYLLAGLASQTPATGTTTADLPSGFLLRAQRIWYVDQTSGGTGNAGMAFNLAKLGVTATTGDNWGLFYRSGTTGNFTALQYIAYDGSGSLNFSVPAPADGYYTIAKMAKVNLSVTKSSTILADGINSSNPKAIPGATITYSINVTSNQDSPDSGTVVVDDTLPTGLDLYVGNFSGTGAPFTLVQGTPGCGFTAPFTSLSSTTDSIEFLNASGTAITPAPDANGYDPNVRRIRITPSGQLASYSGTGTAPSCTFAFQARLN